MLDQFADDIWIADGETVSVLGFHYPTRCAVIRLGGTDLLVWSPVALCADLKAQVDALGTVTYLIAPNHLHHFFVAQWQAAYPQAKLYAAPLLANKRPDLQIDGTLCDTAEPVWAAFLDQAVLQNKLTTEVVFFHKPSGTVIFTDLIQQFPSGWHHGWRALIARLDLMVGNAPNVPCKFRLGFTNREQTRHQVQRILLWPIDRILMAHGQPVKQDGRAVLRRSFTWLLK